MTEGPCVDILRFEDGKDGTYGGLLVNGETCCFSLELPWNSNLKGNSCIPEGEYWCVMRKNWFNAAKYGYTYEVMNVPDRDAILFHPANLIRELKGCIAIGSYIGELDGVRGVLRSGAAFLRFKHLIGKEERFRLRIIKLILSTRGCYHQYHKGVL